MLILLIRITKHEIMISMINTVENLRTMRFIRSLKNQKENKDTRDIIKNINGTKNQFLIKNMKIDKKQE